MYTANLHKFTLPYMRTEYAKLMKPTYTGVANLLFVQWHVARALRCMKQIFN